MSNIRKAQLFHQQNPSFYTEFKAATLQLINAGVKHYSARGVFHQLRWLTALRTPNSHGFKVNNNYSAFYARIFAYDFPQYKDFFRFRKFE